MQSSLAAESKAIDIKFNLENTCTISSHSMDHWANFLHPLKI